MRILTDYIKDNIVEIVIENYASNCEMKKNEITTQTNILDELGTDSMLIISLIDKITQLYNIDIDIVNIGKYISKNPLFTINDVVEMFCKMYMYENEILSIK